MRTLLLLVCLVNPILAGAAVCPPPDDLNRYVVAPYDQQDPPSMDRWFRVYYKLLQPFDSAKPTLVLVNGGPGGDHSILDAVANEDFVHRANVLSFDHRGLGCTTELTPRLAGHVPQEFSMDRAADDLDAIRRDLLGPSGKWFLYGVSYGTFLGQAYAVKYHRHLAGLVLDSAMLSSTDVAVARKQYLRLYVDENSVAKEHFDRIRQLYPRHAAAVLEALFPMTYGFHGRTLQIPELLARLAGAEGEQQFLTILAPYRIPVIPAVDMPRRILCEEIYDHPGQVAEHQFYLTFFQRECGPFKGFRKPMDFSSTLSQVRAPTMVWAGKYDPVTPVQAMRRMARLLPEVLLWENAHSGHALLREKHRCAVELLDRFLGGADLAHLRPIVAGQECQSEPESPVVVQEHGVDPLDSIVSYPF